MGEESEPIGERGYSEINNRLDKQLGKYMKKVLVVLKQLLFY